MKVMNMKKTWKILISLVLILTMLFGVIPVEAASALVDVPKTETFTLYSSKDVGFGNTKKNEVYLYSVPSGTVTNLKSSKTAVAAAVKKTYNGAAFIYLKLKKAGKTTVSFKYKSKTYKITVTVQKYKNPVSSIKIGNTKLASSKFKTLSTQTLKYSSYANKKQKITISLAKGWKLQSYETVNINEDTGEFTTKNISGFWYVQKGWQKSSDIKSNKSTITIKGGKGYTIEIPVVNTKTKQEEVINIIFK